MKIVPVIYVFKFDNTHRIIHMRIQLYKMNQPLKKVGKYRLIKRIGKGATAQVFQAKKDGSSQKFAIKMIRLKGLSADQQAFITKQVTIIKNIDHPNIVHLHQTFQTTNNYYLVFEYCERGDLQKYLMEFMGIRIPQETAQKILYCIADAVSLIHQKGIAHRDIKLANILIKKNYQIKLADFGFAKEAENILMKTYCGTPITMAPQILLDQPYDKKCDIWSLGVITFQLVYGRLPFAITDGLPKFIQYVTQKQLQIPSQPIMTPEFKQLLIGSLQKDPRKRLSITEFLANKWIQEGSEVPFLEGTKIKKKPSVDELLRNISQQFQAQKISNNQASEVQLLVAQRVNKIMVEQIKKLLFIHVQFRNRLFDKLKGKDESMTNLLLKLDLSFLQFISNLPLKVGKQTSSLTIKANQLDGLQFPKPLAEMQIQSDFAGNVVMAYLQKTAFYDAFTPTQKLQRYKNAIEILQFVKRFDIRVIILFANHIYEDIEVQNIIESIRTKKINEQVSQQIQFTKGNYITIAMECCDKDDKMKNIRKTLQENLRKRVQEIQSEINNGF